jgi:hypothetical protein
MPRCLTSITTLWVVPPGPVCHAGPGITFKDVDIEEVEKPALRLPE